MHVPNWALSLLFPYIKERSLTLNYMNERSERNKLPEGFGAGTRLGGLCFIVKINGACMRPPIPRPITQKQCMQVKFVDDATQIASVDLKKSLIQDTVSRQRPLNFHEQTEIILSPEENILNTELQRFPDFTVSNKLVMNRKKFMSWSFLATGNTIFQRKWPLVALKYLK